MKALILSILLIYLVHRIEGNETEKYTTKYDGIDLSEILSSERLLTGYVNCLLDQGPCTPDGKELKRNLPDAIDNDCAKCTERQRAGADEVMHYIIDHRPVEWDKLERKYQSDGSYKRKYLESKTRIINQDTDNNENDKSENDDTEQTQK